MLINKSEKYVDLSEEKQEIEISLPKYVYNELNKLGKGELRYYNRVELLEILLDYAKENEKLKNDIDLLQTKLEDKKIEINKFGSIAEASIGLNGVFEAAEKSCFQYIENAKLICDKKVKESEEILEKAKSEAEEIVNKAKSEIQDIENEKERLLKDTLEKCNEMERDTTAKCEKLSEQVEKECEDKIAESQKKIDENWDVLSKRLDSFYESHKGLRELMDQGIFNMPHIQMENKVQD